MSKDHVNLTGFVAILTLTFLWGLNYAAIKFSNAGLSPIFTTCLRSAIASGCGILYCLVIRQPLFQRGILLVHGIVIGLLFGLDLSAFTSGYFTRMLPGPWYSFTQHPSWWRQALTFFSERN